MVGTLYALLLSKVDGNLFHSERAKHAADRTEPSLKMKEAL